MTPNQITMIRIFLIPFVIFFYLADFIPWGKFIALIIFAVACLTDFIDGKLARKTGQVTDLGKFLDTNADKLLLIAGLLLILADGILLAPYGVIIVIIILSREFLVSALRQIAAGKNVILAADKWGKYKAFLQDLAVPAFMLLAFLIDLNASAVLIDIVFYTSWALMGIAVILTLISGVNYFVKNWAVFKDDKKTCQAEENGKVETNSSEDV